MFISVGTHGTAYCYGGFETVWDSPQVFFSVDFLRNGRAGFVIDWSAAECNIPRNHHQPCHEKCMKGVVVKGVGLNTPRIWVLTGEADTSTHGGTTHLHGYEAVWPD